MLPKAKTVYFHVDVNSAFLSWTAIQHLANGETLDLRTVPAVVGGDEEKRHGVVLAKSIPAKRYGIQTGESLFMARSKYPNLIVAAPDFDWYVKNSKAMIRIFGDYTPDIEQYSIDEAFLNMTGSEGLFGPPLQAAQTIKDRIHRELGFTVNIGIAPNRLLAKMASDFEKPDKVHTLFAHEIPQKLWPLPVGSLFSVGRSTAEKLTAARIRTIGDLAQADLAYIQRLTGVKLGKLIHDYANGIDDAPVLAEPEAVKGYGNSVTLEQDVTTQAQANQILLALCDSVASRMRADSRRCACVTVTIRGNDFRNQSHQRRLPEPTDVTAELYAMSRTLFSELWDGVTPLRLLGVTLNDLCRDDAVQLSLFRDEKKERARKLDQTVDQLRGKFGVTAISRGSVTDASRRVGRKYKAELDPGQK